MSEMLGKAHRRALLHVLAAVMLAGIVTLPNEVLCVAPGGHFAIEMVSGGICSEGFDGGMRTGHRQPDGCPANCRDTQIGNQIQRSDARPFSPASVAFLLAAPAIDTFSPVRIFTRESRFPFRRPPQELQTTVIRC